MSTQIEQIAQRVADLQKDMNQVGNLVERLDITIEKLTEVSTTVSQLLAVQGNRLEVQERLQEKLQDMVERRKTETDDAINKTYLRMERIEEKLQNNIKDSIETLKKDVADTNDEIIKALDEIKNDIKSNNEHTNTRMSTLEKWMWTLAGVVSTTITGVAVAESLFNIF